MLWGSIKFTGLMVATLVALNSSVVLAANYQFEIVQKNIKSEFACVTGKTCRNTIDFLDFDGTKSTLVISALLHDDDIVLRFYFNDKILKIADQNYGDKLFSYKHVRMNGHAIWSGKIEFQKARQLEDDGLLGSLVLRSSPIDYNAIEIKISKGRP